MLQPEPTFRRPSRRGDNDDVERVSAASSEVDSATSEAAGHALTAFAAAALELVRGESADAGLRALARAVALGTGAELVVVRVAVDGDGLVARAVQSESAALAAELDGTRMPLADAGTEELDLEDAPGDPSAPAAVRRVATRAGAPIVRFVPVTFEGEVVAALELYRSGLPFGPNEQALARAAAAHLTLALRLDEGSNGHPDLTLVQLELLGEALAAGADEAEAAEQIVRVAGEAAESAGALLWRIEPESAPTFLAADGFGGRTPDLTELPEIVRRAVDEGECAPREVGPWLMHTVPLGEPPVAALQLAFEPGEIEEPELARLAPFAVGAALALRRSRRVSLIALALKRSQTLIAVVSQAIAQLSLTHTLETAVDRVAELTSSGHVGIYLQEGDRLVDAASRNLSGPHTDLAERLLALALGPFRSRGFLFIEDMQGDPRLSGLDAALEEGGVRRALFIPLLVRDEVIGALGVFKTRPRPYREGEEGLLIALSSQLAVAVQNARLHERTEGAVGRSSSRRSTPSAVPLVSCAACTRSASRSPRASRWTRPSRPSHARWSASSMPTSPSSGCPIHARAGSRRVPCTSPTRGWPTSSRP